ncbi:MAG TPA: sulfite exporter TauE/SafE family protein [Chloroflexota bacterium]|nr:sulfite exporter TauE/SafE family protein [Chloroflexota bacterium]
MPYDLSLILIGLGIGFLVGLTGVGGGSLMTPILVLVMGMPAAVAVGTDLAYSAVTRTVGAVVHIQQKTVKIDAVKWLATGSVPAALISTVLVGYALRSAKHFTQGFITHALAAVLIFVAVSLLLRPWLENHFAAVSINRQRSFSIAMGVLIGALVALTSVGGGSLTIVALVVLYKGISTSDMIGTDVVHAAILTLVAASAHIFISTVDFHVTLLLLVGSLPGVIIGSRLTLHVPDTYLRLGMAGTLAFVGIRLI